MIALLLAVLALGANATTGDLVINVAAGTEVFVDNVAHGVAAANGATVTGLAPGAHRVEMRAPNGGTAGFKVTIVAGETQTINVSPLGFRIRPKTEVPVAALRIVSDVAPCDVSIGDVVARKNSYELNIGTVPVGKQKLSIVCGERRITSIVTLAPDELQIIEPDFDRRVAKVLAHRRRVTTLTVDEGQEEIVSANMPVEWKRVLSGAAGSSRATSVVPMNLTTVFITYRCPTLEDVARVIDRLRSSLLVEKVDPQGLRRDGEAAIVTLRVRFRPMS